MHFVAKGLLDKRHTIFTILKFALYVCVPEMSRNADTMIQPELVVGNVSHVIQRFVFASKRDENRKYFPLFNYHRKIFKIKCLLNENRLSATTTEKKIVSKSNNTFIQHTLYLSLPCDTKKNSTRQSNETE